MWVGPIKDRRALSGLYRDAAVVLVHSLSESFGLTLLEAATWTSKIAAADLPVHREVLWDAVYYEPRSLTDLIHALKRANSRPPHSFRFGFAANAA